ncbi:MAG: ABC transporter substrate-binding protein [Desulfobacteraceae bacterium IS3]|nr:MAG: ABC transporter substrate-binding protein [Desulfobacteraceae bacterium IS3]
MSARKSNMVWGLAALMMISGLLFSSTGHAAETYKIGGIFSVTGASSFLGDPEKKSLEMAIEEINAKGGIDGRKLEAVIYDTEDDPTKSVMHVSKLISKDQVVAIIGPSTTPTTLAIIPSVEKDKMPLISCAAGNAITKPIKPYVFKTAQSDILAAACVYGFMKKQNIQKVGILTVANAFGESGKEQLLKQAEKFGIQVVQSESFGDKDTDMTAQLTKLRKAEPQAIICWGTNPGPAVIAKNVKQLNLNIPLYQSHGVASPKFIELAGDAAEGIYLPTGKPLVAKLLPDSDPQKKVLMDYIKSYDAKYKSPVSGFGGYAYDAMQILAKALVGTNGDKQKIRDNLEKVTGHVGVSGTFNFSKDDHEGLSPDAFVMVQIKNKTWELAK